MYAILILNYIFMGRKPFRKLTWTEKFNLHPHLTHGLVAIVLFMTSALAALSFVSKAGVVGYYIDSGLALVFGQVRYVFPMVLMVVGFLVIKDLNYEYRATHGIGAILFLWSFNGLIHLSEPTYDRAIHGLGGGFLGLSLSFPLFNYIGYWGALVILISILAASLVLLFNTSLIHLVELHKKIFLGFGWLGKKIISFANFFKRQNKTQITANFAHEEQPDENEDDEEVGEETVETVMPATKENSVFAAEETENSAEENMESIEESTEIELAQPKKTYVLPPIDLLYTTKSKPTSGDIKSSAHIIQETFENFGIDVEMGEIRVGPTVTQFSLKPAKGVKLTRITTLSNDLALALAAHPIRIEAPIPGQSLVGIEVPNQRVAMVSLRELIESAEFKQRPHNMFVTLGKDVAGKVWVADLPKMPHLLIAGSTGSGKTVGINTIILSLLYQNTPDSLRLIMVDPKRVELTLYNGIPHLLTPVITDAVKTVNALKWSIGEMERRFEVLSKAGKRDITSYNKSSSEPLPHIVFIIDELADLMAAAGKEIEAGIIRLAQMARAIGIHLIVATQRPSVEVITGLMKANIPGRIAFSVASLVDSRTILDCSGAEKLLGRGDMLFLTAELSKPKRIQGAYVSEEEMKRVVDYLKGDEPPVYDDSIVSKNTSMGSGTVFFDGNSSGQDSLFEEAKQMVIESEKASASLLQRRLKVGYARAARLLDELEEAGIVGPADGAKPREVFLEHLSSSFDKPTPSSTDSEHDDFFVAPPSN
jgi:S-DNA-T family DNA segregation ATPase FtsK/SpoIIIE